MAQIEHRYVYAAVSRLKPDADGFRLGLVTENGAAQGHYLTGFARTPEVTARGLRAVSQIVGSRFYTPPAMLARILREADPVATVSQGATRFEGFSACCSVYARHDMDPSALDIEALSPGTTNVDFGAELRAALAQVRRDSRLKLSVGADAVEISHDRAQVIERKVPLPLRWVRGFAEVQSHLAGMKHATTLPRVVAQRFLRSLPKGDAPHPQWLVVSGAAPRLSARSAPGGVQVRGAHRLRALEVLAAQAQALHVHANEELGSSAWTLDFGDQRLMMVLNAEPWRGFSGDGRLLSDLAKPDDAGVAALKAQLNWQAVLDRETLAQVAGLSPERTGAALARLAALGLVGFDLHTGAWFHRALPFDMDRLQALNPRLKSARALVESGAVSMGPDSRTAFVRSNDVTHHVLLSDAMSCTCPWYAANGSARGPCKHMLAVEISLRDGP